MTERTMPDAWILTHTGRRFYPLEPRVEDVDIRDIAYSLARTARFNGHIPHCNVAQHSIYVASLVPDRHKLWALLHDAAEAYIGDMPSPIKQRFPHFQQIEDNILRIIAQKYDLSLPIPDTVKTADRRACLAEARAGWDDDTVTDDWCLQADRPEKPPWVYTCDDREHPDLWENVYLRQFQALTRSRNASTNRKETT